MTATRLQLLILQLQFLCKSLLLNPEYIHTTMKSFKIIYSIIALAFASVVFAQDDSSPIVLPDGTELPADTVVVVGEDGTTEYQDAAGNVLAQVSTKTNTDGSTVTTVVVKTTSGSFIQKTVTTPAGGGTPTITNNGVVSTPTPVVPANPLNLNINIPNNNKDPVI